MEQFDILGGAKPLGRTAPRQDAALELLREHPEGCSADEIGAAIHASAGKHGSDEICRWCGPDGRDVLRALERKHLVVRTGCGLFTLRKRHPLLMSYRKQQDVGTPSSRRRSAQR